jgi:hypothetical protein
MDNETRDALLGSIEKWKKIEEGTGKDNGCDNCPLCKIFLVSACQGCPVHERTGLPICYGTPYMVWTRAVIADNRYGPYRATTPQLKELAHKEREFLESLL